MKFLSKVVVALLIFCSTISLLAQNLNNPQAQTNQKYQPNVANIPVTPEAPPAPDVVKKDYFGLKLRGLQDEDIWVYLNQENIDRQKQGLGPVTVTLDKEQSWNIYKDDVYKGDRKLFDQQWETVANEYKAFKEKKEEDLYHAWNSKQLEDPRPNLYSIQGELPFGRKFEEFKPAQKAYVPKGYAFDAYGQLIAIKSQEEMADSYYKELSIKVVVCLLIIGCIIFFLVRARNRRVKFESMNRK